MAIIFNVPITKKHKQMCQFKSNVPRRPDYFIKPDDARRWLEWLKEHRSNPVYWRLASFMLLTGARVGEACGMKWDADLEQEAVRVMRPVRWDQFSKFPFLEDVTKTSQSIRILVLPKKLQEILFQMKKESVNDFVFTDSKKNLLKYNSVQSWFYGIETSLAFHPYLPSYFCNNSSCGNKKSFCRSSQSWTLSAEYDSKVCEGCRSFEFRYRRENICYIV